MRPDNFLRLLRAEWTKLWSVRRWAIALVGAGVLTVLLGLLVSSLGSSDVNQIPNFVVGPHGEPVSDESNFVHQTVTGDTAITVRVTSLSVISHPSRNDQDLAVLPDTPWAGAGVMIKDGTRSGSGYASVLLTPHHGVRMQANYDNDLAGSAAGNTRWLRLVRKANVFLGYESADGVTWQRIGMVSLPGLPSTAEVGFFASAEPVQLVVRSAGSTGFFERAAVATAVVDHVSLVGAAAGWHADNVVRPSGPDDGGQGPPPPSGFTEANGVFTVDGSGKIGPNPPDDDVVQLALYGVQGGLMALIAVAVLFVTTEYRRGMIRTTFTASPRRGRVLAAKALVIGGVAFAVGLVAATISFFGAPPILRQHGYGPPAFPAPSIVDGSTLRAILLTAGFMAAVAVFSLALGTILRHSAVAITTSVVLVVLPIIAGSLLQAGPARWLMRFTLAGGFATQRAKPPSESLAQPWTMLSPWTGFATAWAYALVALLVAGWFLRRRSA